MYMIYYFKPYSTSQNLGEEYNRYMELLKDDDWACLMDGDTQFLTSDFGDQISCVVNENPDVGMFTFLTNRCNSLELCYNNEMSDNFDIKHHRKIARELKAAKKHSIREILHPISGYSMLIKKSVWEKNGKFFPHGILNVDMLFGRKLLDKKYKIFVMEGVYIFHSYRVDTDISDRSHLLSPNVKINRIDRYELSPFSGSKAEAWNKVRETWKKSESFLDSISSRGIIATIADTINIDSSMGERVSDEIYEQRRVSCFGNSEHPPCEELKYNKDNNPFCGSCGCGSNKLAILSPTTEGGYSKLHYPQLECPLKKPGFSNFTAV